MAVPNKKDISFLQKKLLSWFDVHGRYFPWRKKKLTHYQVIIAEVLLQRTKAETVAKFYNKFINEYHNWDMLADADLNTIESYLKPIGLYRQRALRLHNLSKEMVRRKYRLPRERTELEGIPLFGQYITNAINLIIFNKPTPLMDVNMARVLERFFNQRKMADIRYDPDLQELATKVVTVPKSKDLNWAILDFAALVCTAQKPKCEICMLSVKCTYFNKRFVTN